MSIKQNFPEVSPSLLLDFANSKTLDPTITFTRASVGTYVGRDGLIKTASNNEPRFDHDPATLESLGLLIEESRTNVAESSEDFGNTSFWLATNQTITTNVATAPDGTLTADNIVPASGSAATRYLYFDASAYSMSASASYTTSIFVKKNGLRYFALQAIDNGSGSGLRAGFDLDNGTVVTSNIFGSASGPSASIVEFPNGWFRCILTGTSASGSSTGRTAFSFSSALDPNASIGAITADGSSGGYVWGHQVEAGSFPTSYIPTSGSPDWATGHATVTRAQDTTIIKGTNFTDFYNQTEGTLFGEFTIKDETYSSAAIANINQEPGSSYANSIMFVEVGNAQGYFGRTYKSSSGINLSNSSSVLNSLHPSTTPQKVTFGYTTITGGELRAYWNGNNVTSSSDLSKVPTTLTNMRIGRGWDGSDVINAHIRKLSYYPKRLPDAQLQGLTQQ